MPDIVLQRPIVLVHGLFGFGRVYLGPITFARYFPGIEQTLNQSGLRVGIPQLSLTRGIEERAVELRRYIIRRFPNEQVHIIAHSMGGLDARHMITHLGMADQVHSLTTIGTPHRGSSFADWCIRYPGRIYMPLLRALRIPCQAFEDLTTTSCRRFNENTPNIPNVRYFSVAGNCSRAVLTPTWRPMHRIVKAIEGDNDGVVSLSSAQYGESCEVWHADHMNLVNRKNPRLGSTPREQDYLRLAKKLQLVEENRL
ncbi:MAG: hypothetical protein R3B84_07795 [Zavarzinella sp.]